MAIRPVLIIAAHLGNKVIFYQLSPQTLLVTVNSCNVTQSILSPSAPDTVSTRENKSQKSPLSWGANPWYPALQASALVTRPPWILALVDVSFCCTLQHVIVSFEIFCLWTVVILVLSSASVWWIIYFRPGPLNSTLKLYLQLVCFTVFRSASKSILASRWIIYTMLCLINC